MGEDQIVVEELDIILKNLGIISKDQATGLDRNRADKKEDHRLGITSEKPIVEDSTAIDPDITSKDLVLEDSGIRDNLRRYVVEGQRLARQVAFLFSFHHVLSLLLSFSEVDTISAT